MFPRLQPTENAEVQMLKVIEGASIRFTRVGLGNGKAPSVDIEQLTEMQNLICYGTITSYERNGKNAMIHWQLDTASVESAFDWTEYALFAMDENDNEFLFSYSYNVGKVQPIEASASDSLVMLEMDLNITIGDAEHVSAIIGEYSAYASKEIVNEHISDAENPHNVTKEQIGLGNVENVSVNDAAPKFTEAETDENIVSGESASTLWGKVKKAISSLAAHIANTNNPHGVTAEKINAAKSSHTHSVTDINSGTLSTARGGTGYNNISSFLIAHGLDFFRIKSGMAANISNNYISIPLENGLHIVIGKDSITAGAKSVAFSTHEWDYNFFSRTPLVFVTIVTDAIDRHASVKDVSRKGFKLVFQNNHSTASTNSIFYMAIG